MGIDQLQFRKFDDGEVKLWNSCTKKWDKSMGASFYEKYNEATTYRVKEYFNFNTSY